jgi:nucleoside-diphosphate-sugar epimerase
MKDSIRIAVTSVGSGIGQSIVQSCRFSHLSISIIGFDINPFAFGAYDCDIQELVPKVSDPAYIPMLIDKCRKHGVHLLIPGLDSELLSISERKSDFEHESIHVLVAEPPFIRLCRDKILWSKVLSSISDVIVPCYNFNEIEPLLHSAEVRFPLIAKPIGGSGSVGVKIINTPEKLRQLDDTHVIQPYIFPNKEDLNYQRLSDAVQNEQFRQIAEISVQYVVSKSQRILGRMASYNKLKDGVPIEITPVEDERIWDSLEKLFPYFLQKGMKGPVNFQGRLTDDGPRFFEMNGRFTGITGLRSMMGFNEVETVVRDFLDLGPAGSCIINPRRVGMRQVLDRTVDPEHYPPLMDSLRNQQMYTGHKKKPSILITGATGLLGRNIAKTLMNTNAADKLYILVRNRPKTEEIFSASKGTTPEIIEIEDYIKGRWSIGRIDTILHLASGRIPDGSSAIADGLAFTQRLVTDAGMHQVPVFINISSQAVYGFSKQPLWDESMPPAPESPYGMAKAASECMVESLSRTNRSVRSTSLRLARIFGAAEGMRWDELPHLFARRAVTGEDISIKGGNQRFDLIYIDDAVDAVIKVIESDPTIWKPVYNLGSGGSVSILDIAEEAINCAKETGYNGSNIMLIPDPGNMVFGMNTDLFCHDFNWVPKVTLNEAMRRIISKAISNFPQRTMG